MMKMVMVVVSRDQADRVLDRLISAGYGATFTESRGGMLRQAQQLMFIAVEEEQVDDVVGIIRRECHTKVQVSEQAPNRGRRLTATEQPTVTEVGYGVVFVWDLDRFEVY